MKKLILSTVALLIVFATGAFLINAKDDKGRASLEIGAKAPLADREMLGIDGSKTSLETAAGENGLLVMFSCNTCPFVIYWEDRYPEIYELCKENNIGMIVVNSNEAKREGDDSMEEMKKHAEDRSYDFSYVVDEGSELANAMGAKTTPHAYLFDSELALTYIGAIDDNYKDRDGVEAPYLSNAITNMVNGEPIDPNATKPIGCSIKRVKI